MWTYYLILVKSYSMNLLLTFLLHTVPAFIADAVMLARGKKMRFLNIYKKIHEFSRLLTFFVMKSFEFKSANVRKMLERMSVKDREVFFCDLKQLDWEEFVITYGAGIRVYLVKDPMDTVDKAKRLWRRYSLANRVILTVAGLLAATILWSVMSTLYRSFLFVN
ncbi:fatty acyl-CoA reductase wat-like [Anoplophora glabripennis]|uniref:fatty acyl-CoA reductase wat-like n=1 Tax=Anoplophora glabripennis TaxID=217634 RepID=UPI0008737686|nr:fatty acyl-CoA reductase wat-like [Anoplophora glabripennis]